MKSAEHSSNYGNYGPGSVGWKINREGAILLGGSRAVLIHVHGNLPMDAGAFSKGTRYDAHNPELLLWVHATLVDTSILCYNLFIGSLTTVEQDTFYQESKEVAHFLGLPRDKTPGTVDDLRKYVYDMVHSNRLVATPQARQIAHQLLFPPAPAILRPLMHLNLQLTCALLPQPVREIYGLEWDPLRQLIFDLSARGIRTIIPRLPVYLRELPITRRLIRETVEQPTSLWWGHSRRPSRGIIHKI